VGIGEGRGIRIRAVVRIRQCSGARLVTRRRRGKNALHGSGTDIVSRLHSGGWSEEEVLRRGLTDAGQCERRAGEEEQGGCMVWAIRLSSMTVAVDHRGTRWPWHLTMLSDGEERSNVLLGLFAWAWSSHSRHRATGRVAARRDWTEQSAMRCQESQVEIERKARWTHHGHVEGQGLATWRGMPGREQSGWMSGRRVAAAKAGARGRYDLATRPTRPFALVLLQRALEGREPARMGPDGMRRDARGGL
jgi:hypothetical protein